MDVKVMSAALLVLALTSPDVAQAAPGEVVPQSATSASTSADKTVTVSCPSGTKVVGAGGAVTGEKTTITRIRPSADLSSVEVAAVEHDGGTAAAWTVTARVNCSAGPYTLVSKTAPNAAEATCPGTKKTFGVAGETDGAHLTKVAPRTNLKGALVEAPGTVTAYAICGNGTGLVLRGGTSHVMTTQQGTKAVACQAEEQPISAGGAVSGAMIDDVVPAAYGATVTGETKEDTQAIRWLITAYAVCSQ